MNGITMKPLDNPALRVLSFGAGVQFTVLLFRALHREIGPMPDAVIFADTGFEPRSVYDHLEWCQGEVARQTNGQVGFHVVSAGNIRDDHLAGLNTTGQRFAAMPLFTEGGGIGRRQCTKEYKVAPIRAKVRELLGVAKGQRMKRGIAVEQWLGISTDEIQRAKAPRDRWMANRFPLIEAGMSRGDCLAWWSRNYPDRPLVKSACVACPFRHNELWREMKARDPESWAEAVEFDRQLRAGAVGKRKGDPAKFVHRSLKPLDQADLEDDTPDLFSTECEGMCGL